MWINVSTYKLNHSQLTLIAITLFKRFSLIKTSKKKKRKETSTTIGSSWVQKFLVTNSYIIVVITSCQIIKSCNFSCTLYISTFNLITRMKLKEQNILMFFKKKVFISVLIYYVLIKWLFLHPCLFLMSEKGECNAGLKISKLLRLNCSSV